MNMCNNFHMMPTGVKFEILDEVLLFGIDEEIKDVTIVWASPTWGRIHHVLCEQHSTEDQGIYKSWDFIFHNVGQILLERSYFPEAAQILTPIACDV